MDHVISRTASLASALAALTVGVYLGGCVSAEEPPRAPTTAATPAAPAEPENTWTPQSPQIKWWEAGKAACPPGASLVGGVPPTAFVIECKTPDGKRNGPSSVWFESGHAGTYSEYVNDVPHGRWIYWLHNWKLVEGRYEAGRRQGDWTYAFDIGSGLDMRSRWGADALRSYVLETYDHGLLLRTKHFRDGVPVD